MRRGARASGAGHRGILNSALPSSSYDGTSNVFATLTHVASKALERPTTGAKKRDYWWTVLFTDPVALPLTRLLARRRWVTPAQVSIVSFLLGAAVGPLFALGGRAGLVAGAAVFQLAFIADCIDGKLARSLGTTSARGEPYDRLGDATRRVSAPAGLAVCLFRAEAGAVGTVGRAVPHGAAACFFIEAAGGSEIRRESWFKGQADSVAGEPRGLSRALARRRLLPTPGMPDVQAAAFVLGPLTGLVVPGLIAGLVMLGVGISISLGRLFR